MASLGLLGLPNILQYIYAYTNSQPQLEAYIQHLSSNTTTHMVTKVHTSLTGRAAHTHRNTNMGRQDPSQSHCQALGWGSTGLFSWPRLPVPSLRGLACLSTTQAHWLAGSPQHAPGPPHDHTPSVWEQRAPPKAVAN